MNFMMGEGGKSIFGRRVAKLVLEQKPCLRSAIEQLEEIPP